MTTEKQFELFIEECNKWIDRYSLNDWKVRFLHIRLDGSYAECRFDMQAQKVDLCLDLDGSFDERADDEVIQSAHHEVLELLLCEHELVCKQEPTNDYLIDGFRHKAINRLMNFEAFRREQMRTMQCKKAK